MTALRRGATASLAFVTILTGAGIRPALSQPAATASSGPARTVSDPQAGCNRSAFKVVLDVGHTVQVPGAISARGATEYSFNLRLAQDIRQALAGAGFSQAMLLITATAPPMGLVERAARANAMRADLLLSIHHDSVPEHLLETWTYNGQPQHFSDRFTGYAIFISNEYGNPAGSLMFGKFLGKELQAQGLHYTAHYTLPIMGERRRLLLDAKAGVYEYNKLLLLQYARVPAALLEAGSIVNRQEELDLATPERRAAISAGVTAAVEDFCAARSQRHIAKGPALRVQNQRVQAPTTR